jgi:hypothetical protein
LETRLLAYDRATFVSEIATWANGLIGKVLPDFPQWRVVRIVSFQVATLRNEFSALLLVEVTELEPDDMQHIELRAEDILTIEELTASIDDEPYQGERIPEL